MTRPRPTSYAGAVAVLALTAVACGGDARQQAASSPTVTLRRLAFNPVELSVPAGTTVIWRSAEPIGHTVTSGEAIGVDATTGLRAAERPDGVFDEQLAGTDATFTHRFTEPGTYSYYCAIHKGMNARVVVS